MSMKRMMVIAAVLSMSASPAIGAMERPVPPSVVVESVQFRQRYPWNGLVDIDVKISCSDANTNLAVHVAAWDNVKDRALTVKTVWVDGDATKNSDLTVKSGMTRIVWDARADNPNEISQSVSVSVQAYVRDMRYLVIDLSGGTNATEYACSYLAEPPEGVWTDEYKTTKLVLRLIPAGTFIMGSPEDELGHNYGWCCVETQHKVKLTRPFYVGVFEVTQKQYELVNGGNPSSYKGETRPVEMVTYNVLRGWQNGSHWPDDSLVDTDTFLGRIRKRTGLKFDLPTEAQWEYACRAGTTTALNNGKNLTYTEKCDNMNEMGRYGQNVNDGKGGYAQHTVVGSYPANDWGLYDMHGNVAEWCLDWLIDDLGPETVIDPQGPVESKAWRSSSTFTSLGIGGYYWPGPGRVMRGGCWMGSSAAWLRSGCRSCSSSSRHYTDPRGVPVLKSISSSYQTYYTGDASDWGVRVVVLPDDI